MTYTGKFSLNTHQKIIRTISNYDPGDMTGALPILTVAQINPVKVVINVNESQLSTIHKGMPVDLTFNTYGDEVFKGTVSLVMPTVDAASRTVGVEITLPNSDGRVLPGMFGRATVSHGQASHVVVPDRAVVKQQGSGDHYVYVLKGDGTVSYNKVELGQRIRKRTESGMLTHVMHRRVLYFLLTGQKRK